jgi:thiamine-monophosphate kinase
VLPMSGMKEVLENAAIDAWVRGLSRAPNQVNALHESDAELLEIASMPDHYLVITIDTVAEEIAAGLYRDPFTMGWVTVMASLSDLAAVGADPIGLVVSVGVPQGTDGAFIDRARRGMEEACRSLGVFILGGDLNAATPPAFTGSALGTVPRNALRTRLGIEPGDAVFLSGPAGGGNALGLVRLAGLADRLFPEESYRPSARLAEGRALRGLAGASMDTSDGVLATLDQLMRLNGRGFLVECDWPALLSRGALVLCEGTGTPPWLMLAGPHGEFELVFTVPASRIDAFAGASADRGLAPIRLGTAQERPVVTLALPSGRRVDIDMAPVRNLDPTAKSGAERYLAELAAIGRSWGID